MGAYPQSSGEGSECFEGSKPRDQAIYLALLQSLMDQKGFFQFNTHGYELGQHIKEKGVDTPLRIDFLRGRKTNPQPFNSWLGHDALEAWKRYFEQVRGYPK